MTRVDGRTPAQTREITLHPDFFRRNDCLVSYGATKVYCYASIEERVPQWLVGAGVGWLTAEYNMLPSAGDPRQQRERANMSGRTQEIQRLIGRSLRAALDMPHVPSMTLRVDCEVIIADGGTRTASVTGSMVALANLLHTERQRFRQPIVKTLTAAISVGIVNGEAVVDLNYIEDRDADVDANVVGLSVGGFAEVQATGEHGTFTRQQLDEMLDLASPALDELYALQRHAIRLELP
ncbi:MAG: ribonuclease PH [bacterium]|nr:ribonuclease PH [bacterium]